MAEKPFKNIEDLKDQAVGTQAASSVLGAIEKYKVLEGDLGTEKYAVGFRVDDIKLRETIDKALDEIKEDGTFQQLEEKWF
nr:transporter substrate-binding domain-containing protein [Erysipelothrix piscisicarius]